jgi:hypothetical protein
MVVPVLSSVKITGFEINMMICCQLIQQIVLGKEMGIVELEEHDYLSLKRLIIKFTSYLNHDANEIMRQRFIELFPLCLTHYDRSISNK